MQATSKIEVPTTMVMNPIESVVNSITDDESVSVVQQVRVPAEISTDDEQISVTGGEENFSCDDEEILSATATVEIAATKKETEPLLADFKLIQKYHPLVKKAKIVSEPPVDDGGLVGTCIELIYHNGTQFKETVTDYTSKNGVVDYIRFELSEFDADIPDCAKIVREMWMKSGGPAVAKSSTTSSSSTSLTVKLEYVLKQGVPDEETKVFIGGIGWLSKLMANGAKAFMQGDPIDFAECPPEYMPPPQKDNVSSRTVATYTSRTVATYTPRYFFQAPDQEESISISNDEDPVVENIPEEDPDVKNVTATEKINATQEDVAPLLEDLKKIEEYHPFMKKDGVKIIFGETGGVGAVRRLTYEDGTTFYEKVTELNKATNGVVDRIGFELADYDFPCKELSGKISTENVAGGKEGSHDDEIATLFKIDFQYKLKDDVSEEVANDFYGSIKVLASGIAQGGKELVEGPVMPSDSISSSRNSKPEIYSNWKSLSERVKKSFLVPPNTMGRVATDVSEASAIKPLSLNRKSSTSSKLWGAWDWDYEN